MTEIKVEHRQKPVWPWIVAAIVAILLIVMLVLWQADAPDEDPNVVPETEQTDPSLPEAQPDNN